MMLVPFLLFHIAQVCKTHMLEGSFLQEEHLEQQYKKHFQATGFFLAGGKFKFLVTSTRTAKVQSI